MPKIGNFVFFAPKGTLVFFFCPFSFEPEGKLRWCLPYRVKMETTATSGRLRKVNKSRFDLGQTPPSARRSTHKDIQRRHTQSVWPRSLHFKNNNNRIVQAGFREVVTPWHCLAYMLDNKAKEDRPALPEDLEEIARDAVSEMGGGQLRAMASYEAEDATLYKAAVFRKDIKAMPASNYWGYVGKVCTDSEVRQFADTMQRIVALPASSAGIERIFSQAGLVQSKLRNRLSVAKVGKLVKVARLLGVTGTGEAEALPNMEELFSSDEE